MLLYLGAIILFTVILTASLAAKAHAGAVADWLLVLVVILVALCASHLAVAIVNWLVTLLAAPRPLPRMDFSEGIPPEFRTLVVVPSLLASARNIEDLAEALEVRFLANRDANLCFGLLTDFRDAGEETLPEDEPLLRQAARTDRRSERKVPRCVPGHSRRRLLSVSSSAPLEPPGEDLDGL